MNLYSADPQTLASFFEVVGAGVAVFDIHDRRDMTLLCTNSAFRTIYDLNQIPPELPSELAEVFTKHACDCAQQLSPSDFDHPLASGKQWLRISMIPVFPQPEGETIRIFATAVDITARRSLEQDLQVAHARLSSIVDASYEGIVTIDANQKIKGFNLAASHIFGYAPDEIAGQALETLIPERFRARHPTYVHEFRGSSDSARPMESRVEVAGRRKDGSEFLAEITIAKIKVDSAVEFTAFIRDISEHMRLMDELYLRASTDPLTGLHNRRHTTEEAAKELARARRFSHPTTAMLIDIDDFKSINDIYGHHIGDRVLREAATVCRREARQSDLVARWGGEEFLLLLPETDMDGAMYLAKRILEKLQGLHTDIDQLENRRITASIGVSMLGDDNDNFEAMVYRADQAMYTAKNTGKNRVIPSA